MQELEHNTQMSAETKRLKQPDNAIGVLVSRALLHNVVQTREFLLGGLRLIHSLLHYLDRDLDVVLVVVRPNHLAKRALSELFDDFVSIEQMISGNEAVVAVTIVVGFHLLGLYLLGHALSDEIDQPSLIKVLDFPSLVGGEIRYAVL